MKHILFTGGGSAGHVVPNLALMNEMKFTHKLSYMGTSGIERQLVTAADYDFYTVECPKLVRSFTLQNLKIPFRLHRAVKQAEDVLQQIKPDLVFSKGGFASYPAAKAAFRLNIPVVTHESDLSAGLCTKLLAKKCRYVLTSFPETAEKFKNGMHAGSPMRKEIFCGERSRALHKYGFTGKRPVLLILGGGSGSRAINEAVRERLNVLQKKFDILHLCGKGNAISNAPEGYVQREYESDMGSAYACADLVLSRAGSNTVFELLALKKPSVLVPLQHGSRGDQVENAVYFQQKGLCVLLSEGQLDSLPTVLNAALENEALKRALQDSSIDSGNKKILAVLKSI